MGSKTHCWNNCTRCFTKSLGYGFQQQNFQATNQVRILLIRSKIIRFRNLPLSVNHPLDSSQWYRIGLALKGNPILHMMFQLYSVISSTIVQLVFIVVINCQCRKLQTRYQSYLSVCQFLFFSNLRIQSSGSQKINITKRMLSLKKPSVW